MTATIDYSTEAALTTLFDVTKVDEVTLYLGLDPAVAKEHQPQDVEQLMLECLHAIETIQASVILQKTVTLDLPYKALCRSDGRIYIPYGAPTITSMSYYKTTTGNEGDPARTRTAIDTETFFTDLNYPAFLYSSNWDDLVDDIDDEMPLPIRIVYTTGYTSFASMPRSIYSALKILAQYTFANRGEENVELPSAFHYYADQNLLTQREVQEYIL
jgi:hypothetical protein